MARKLSAGRILMESGIDPAEVRRILPRIEPYAVDIRIAPRFVRMLWASGIAAMAMPWTVLVRPDLFDRMRDASDPGRVGPLVVHELAHLDQFARLGPARHIAQYVGDYLRGRLARRGHWDAYRAVRLEVDARRVARQFAEGRGPV